MIHTIRSALIIGAIVSMTTWSVPRPLFASLYCVRLLKWRSSVVRNLTLSFASAAAVVNSRVSSSNLGTVDPPTFGATRHTSTARWALAVVSCSCSELSAAFRARQYSISPSGPPPTTVRSASLRIVAAIAADQSSTSRSSDPTSRSSRASESTDPRSSRTPRSSGVSSATSDRRRDAATRTCAPNLLASPRSSDVRLSANSSPVAVRAPSSGRNTCANICSRATRGEPAEVPTAPHCTRSSASSVASASEGESFKKKHARASAAAAGTEPSATARRIERGSSVGGEAGLGAGASASSPGEGEAGGGGSSREAGEGASGAAPATAASAASAASAAAESAAASAATAGPAAASSSSFRAASGSVSRVVGSSLGGSFSTGGAASPGPDPDPDPPSGRSAFASSFASVAASAAPAPSAEGSPAALVASEDAAGGGWDAAFAVASLVSAGAPGSGSRRGVGGDDRAGGSAYTTSASLSPVPGGEGVVGSGSEAPRARVSFAGIARGEG